MPPDSTRGSRPGSAYPFARTRRTPPVDLIDSEAQVDMKRLRTYRLDRVRAELRRQDFAGILLFDPINIRYATGSRNMAVWTLHNAGRYAFVPTEGPVVLFEFHGCAHLSAGLESIAEIRPARAWYFYAAGPLVEKRAGQWAAEIADLVRAHGGGNKRLALDHCDLAGAQALQKLGIEPHEGEGVMEFARRLKSPDEIALMGVSLAVCETGMARMRDALEPGITENQLWALLHETNIAMGGEWIETRLLASGGRTNPWFAESSDRIIRPGELVSFDTDLIGPYGYCADLSRTYFCGSGKPTPKQRELYRLAFDQIHHNLDVLKPGLTSKELVERSFQLPVSCLENRYCVVYHGVGLADEYPQIVYLEDLESGGYDGLVEPGMTLCVESYIGEVGGDEGVKLEQQVLVTETGCELLTSFPFEEELLAREI
ncbi:MAG TPA: Xaa-Pro peptidase family protein [Candidatus Binatia bacterium]|nr:Xaa-Pro peptidase family protein [Candidatus Binatia bacterium]